MHTKLSNVCITIREKQTDCVSLFSAAVDDVVKISSLVSVCIIPTEPEDIRSLSALLVLGVISFAEGAAIVEPVPNVTPEPQGEESFCRLILLAKVTDDIPVSLQL